MSPGPKLNVLASYAHLLDEASASLRSRLPGLLTGEDCRLIIDSGAYTVWSRGVALDLDAYCRFLRSYAAVLPAGLECRAVQLDVFGDPGATYRNWRAMLDRGFADVMPVFTRGDTPGRLEEFYRATDYVMFGGIVVGGKNLNYVKWFMERNGGRKIHWLGFCHVPFIQRYRPESADASSWMQVARYGGLTYYGGGGVLKKAERGWPLPREALAAVRRLGFAEAEIARLSRPEAWRGTGFSSDRGGMEGGLAALDGSRGGAAALMSVAAHVYRMTRVEAALGTKLYLAVASLHWMVGLRAVFDLLRLRGVI